MSFYLDNILIIGAGGFGREIYSWLVQHKDHGIRWMVKGFLDDVKANGNISPKDPLNDYPVKVLGSIDDYSFEKNDFCVVAIGDPRSRESVVAKLDKKNANYFSFVHQTVIKGENTIIGKGCIICPNVTISCDAEIGDFVVLNIASTVGHDVKIKEFATLSGHADITGYCKVGRGVFMGTHAALTPKTEVEDYAVIGAGTVGIRRVKANTTILGVPGKKFEIKK